jgi:hypothetical protein
VKAAAVLIAALVTVLALASAPGAAAQSGPPACVGDTEADAVPRRPGPRLRFGITPLVQAGQIGAQPAPAVPEQPARTNAALALLRPAGAPFVLRLNRFFWSDGEAAFRRYLGLAKRFTSRGYEVELQVRYHPSPSQEGDIGAWTRHVREVVRRFGANPGVVALQITNEVNIGYSPDSSDGSYTGARDALVKGVIAAKDEVGKRGYGRLKIGFNWAYRQDPATEQSFWQGVRDRGGRAFVAALDWFAVDAYPGTVFPPSEATTEDYRDGMVNAMSALRCYAQVPGIPPSLPMKIEENGWPTFPGRSFDTQADVLEAMVRAVSDFRGTYHVSDYRWFNLRDGDSSSPQPFQHFGLMTDDYTPKPAFGRYRRLVAELTTRYGGGGRRGRRARLRLRLRFRKIRHLRSGRRCARGRVRATVVGRDRRLARRAVFYRGRRRVAVDRRRPLSRIVDRGRHRGRSHTHVARARVRLRDGRLARLRKRYRVCARSRLARRR